MSAAQKKVKPHSRMDVKAAFNRRVMWLGNGAFGALMRIAAWSNDNLSDGRVDETLVRSIASELELARLRAVPPWGGLPSLEDTETPGTFFIHDFFEWNDAAETVRKRKADKEHAAAVRWEAARNAAARAPAHAAASAPAHAESMQPGVGVVSLSGSGSGSSSPDPTQTLGSPAPAEPDPPSRRKRAARRPVLPATPPPPSSAEPVDVAAWAERWQIPPDHGDFPKFLDNHRAKGHTFCDWTAAWRTWLRNAATFASSSRDPPPSGTYRRGPMLQQPARPGEFNWRAARGATP